LKFSNRIYINTVIVFDEHFVVEETCESELEFFASIKDERLKLWRGLCDAVTEDNEHVTDTQVRLTHTSIDHTLGT